VGRIQIAVSFLEAAAAIVFTLVGKFNLPQIVKVSGFSMKYLAQLSASDHVEVMSSMRS
jgi:hypothetical protein